MLFWCGAVSLRDSLLEKIMFSPIFGKLEMLRDSGVFLKTVLLKWMKYFTTLLYPFPYTVIYHHLNTKKEYIQHIQTFSHHF